MQVLHLINGESYAGAERVQDLLALSLPEFDFEVSFCSVKAGRFDALRRSRDVAVLETVPMRSRFDFGVAARIAEFARGRGIRLIHTHTVRSAMIGRKVARRLGLPMIHHVHSPTRSDTEQVWRNRINAWVDEHYVMPAAARLIPVSESLRRYLVERGMAAERIRVVPNGVPSSDGAGGWVAPSDGWTIGTMALFRPRKGLEVLIEAFALLRHEKQPVKLLVVGTFETPQYDRTIRALAQSLGVDEAIEWAGFKSDVAAQLERMHVFALPSLYGEGMPMVVLEAMAMGLPIVASNVEGIGESLDGGHAGMLVEPGNAPALAAALRQLIAAPASAAALGARARQRQRAMFSDRAMAGAVASIYREVLAGK